MGTTIPCSDTTRERLEDLRGDGYRSWDTFLNDMADAFEAREGSDGTPQYEFGSDTPIDYADEGDYQTLATSDDVADIEQQLRRLSEQVDRVPQDTADELEGRMR